jgi:hypothetical protein
VLPDTLIHLLDIDSLLIVFPLCQLVILDESEVHEVQFLGGIVYGGGTDLYKSVVDGDTSCLSQHFTCKFPSILHLEDRDQIAGALSSLPIIVDHFSSPDLPLSFYFLSATRTAEFSLPLCDIVTTKPLDHDPKNCPSEQI